MNFREPTLHMVLCIVAIVVGCLVFANVIHVQPHESTGLLLASLGVLLLV